MASRSTLLVKRTTGCIVDGRVFLCVFDLFADIETDVIQSVFLFEIIEYGTGALKCTFYGCINLVSCNQDGLNMET